MMAPDIAWSCHYRAARRLGQGKIQRHPNSALAFVGPGWQEHFMTSPPDILCIGSVLWDIIGRSPASMRLGSDVPGRITRLPGGVAMNIAGTLARFGARAAILSAIGRDAEGDALIAACAHLGLITEHVYRSDDLPTDRYMAVEGANGLIAAVADAHSLEAAGDKILRPLENGALGSAEAPWSGPIAIDGNLTEALLAQIAVSPLFAKADLRLAPASPGKAERLLPLLAYPRATLYVNLEEANSLTREPHTTAPDAAAALLSRGAARVLVTDGGRACAMGSAAQGVIVDAPPAVLVARVTGAGDTFMAAHIMAERRGEAPAPALASALRAAATYVSGEIGS
jgi:sugar/nucleoside kinase (ribokinase family)